VVHSRIFLRVQKTRWQHFVLFLALFPGLTILNSCGSGSTAAAPTISVYGAESSANAGGPTVQFTASVQNLSSTLVTWQVNSVTSGNAQYGTIDTNGLYTPPATQPTNDIVTITAIAQAQTSLTATATITILAPAAITGIAPSPAQPVAANSSEQFTATVAGGNTSTVVEWYVSNLATCSTTAYQGTLGGGTSGGSNVGTISPNGLTANYTAPQIPPPGGFVTIYAVSQGSTQLFYCVPVQLTFGNATLQGSFAFSTSGRVVSTNAFFARAGSFTASCPAGSTGCTQGTLIGGIEDTNQAGTVTQQIPFTGSYTIGADGRGTMQFCEHITTTCTSGAATSFFRIVVSSTQQSSTQQAQMIEFSPPGSSNAVIAAGGEMDLQNQSIYSAGLTNLSGSYSFNFAGVSSGSTYEAAVGEFTANGNGNILAGAANTTPGTMDINPGGTQTLTASSYTVSTNGRGTATIGSLNFSFYLVSASRAKFIEIDPSPASILVGDAFKQQTTLTCAWGTNVLNGSSVFLTSGSSLGAGIVDVGSFTANGSGGITLASIDENNGGTVSSRLGTLTGSYTIDPCGRGTMTIGGNSYVFYPISASNSAVLLETTSQVSAHGFLNQPQGGPFVDSTLTGSYAMSLAGVNAPGATGGREDILAQLTADGGGDVTAGSFDFNNFGFTQTGISFAGIYLPTAGTLRATMNLGPAHNLVLYQISPTQFYVLDTDATTVAGGSLYNQF
jgi:hypothetical protein